MNGEDAPMPPIAKMRQGERWFVKRLIKEVKTKDQNRLILMTGATGCGKSLGELRIAECILQELGKESDKRFWMFFDDREFSSYIYKDDILRLDVVLWDDPGITEASSYRQQTKEGQLITFVMQSWRHRNVILLVSSPTGAMLNKNIRRFAHYELKPPAPNKRWRLPSGFQHDNINRKRQLSIWDIKEIEYEPDDPRTGTDKIYKKYMRESNRRSGEIERVETLTLKKPNPTWIAAYDAKKPGEMMSIYRRKIDSFDYRQDDGERELLVEEET